MLRLWPDQYRLGLFPQTSWLRSGAKEHATACSDDGTDCNALVQVAGDLLGLPLRHGIGRPAIDITLSDQAARVVLLPWQDRLHTSAQMRRYAEACLADRGVTGDAEWLVKANFRRFGSSGLAMALRRDFLEEIVGRIRKSGCRLRSVLPLSASAYWTYSGVAGNRDGCLLLHEANRITGYRYRGRNLVSIDVEPVMGRRFESSLARLLQRQNALWSPAVIEWWSASAGEFRDDVFSRLAPGTPIRQLDQSLFG